VQHKKAITNFNKAMIVGQFLVVLVFFAFFLFFVPKLEYPLNDVTLEKKDVEFKFSHAKVILIDDNEDFSSPKQVNLNEQEFNKILFEPGTYYWKAVGLVESLPRKFIVPSTVGLELDEENKTLKNVGDVELDVESSSGITGLVILDVDIEYPVETEKGIIYQGGQHEN